MEEIVSINETLFVDRGVRKVRVSAARGSVFSGYIRPV